MTNQENICVEYLKPIADLVLELETRRLTWTTYECREQLRQLPQSQFVLATPNFVLRRLSPQLFVAKEYADASQNKEISYLLRAL